jgi:hypothetical protein
MFQFWGSIASNGLGCRLRLDAPSTATRPSGHQRTRERYASSMRAGIGILVGLVLLAGSCSAAVFHEPCGDAGIAELAFDYTSCEHLSARVLALCGASADAGQFNVSDRDACGTIWGAASACTSVGGTFACQPDMDACLGKIDDAGTCAALTQLSCGLTCYYPFPD